MRQTEFGTERPQVQQLTRPGGQQLGQRVHLRRPLNLGKFRDIAIDQVGDVGVEEPRTPLAGSTQRLGEPAANDALHVPGTGLVRVVPDVRTFPEDRVYESIWRTVDFALRDLAEILPHIALDSARQQAEACRAMLAQAFDAEIEAELGN